MGGKSGGWAGTRYARHRPYAPLLRNLCKIHITDTACGIATVFDKWNCLIKTDIHAKSGERTTIKDGPIRGLLQRYLKKAHGMFAHPCKVWHCI